MHFQLPPDSSDIQYFTSLEDFEKWYEQNKAAEEATKRLLQSLQRNSK